MNSTIFLGQRLSELAVRPFTRGEQARYQAQMAQHHYFGDLPKIGETLWYVATWREHWVAQLSVSAAALKCRERDRWIGLDFRTQFGRLKLIANSSRFLILPEGRWPNVGSKALSLLERRIGADWQRDFGHRLLLLETFVDPRRFHGGVYRAASIPDPRRAQERRHRLPVVLALAASASLCGMRGYKAMADWAKGLGQAACALRLPA